MLQKGCDGMSTLSVLNFLNDNFGYVNDLGQVDDTKMPLFLKSEFEYRKIEILGMKFVIAEVKNSDEVTIDRLENRKSKMAQYLSVESIVFVFEEISHYMRRRLIEEKISFVVNGKMIYILELGTVFSERAISKYTRQIKLKNEQIKPATQALLLYLLKTQDFSSSMSEIAKVISVSVMSVSRAFLELKKFGFIDTILKDEKETYAFKGRREEVWEMAKPYMINPVVKTVYLNPNSVNNRELSSLLISGESALSRYSMLSAPLNEVFGIHKSIFSEEFKDVPLLPISEKGSLTVQIFSHKLFSKGDCLDKLSTALVLIDETDERVRAEVDRMLEEYFGEEVTNG